MGAGHVVIKSQKTPVRIEIVRETYATPGAVEERLKLAGGLNRFGDANYRAVWGWNRLAWIGGKFEEHDAETGSLLREVVELRQEPKYPAVNRWHVERWMAPEAYGSASAWYAQTLEITNGKMWRRWSLSGAWRLRALLYVGRTEWGVLAVDSHGGRAYRASN